MNRNIFFYVTKVFIFAVQNQNTMKTYIIELASGFEFVVKAKTMKLAKEIAQRNCRLSGDCDKVVSARRS